MKKKSSKKILLIMFFFIILCAVIYYSLGDPIIKKSVETLSVSDITDSIGLNTIVKNVESIGLKEIDLDSITNVVTNGAFSNIIV